MAAHVASNAKEVASRSLDLSEALTGLSPSVQRQDARLVASVAVEYSEDLAREYRIVPPALLHNLLVNVGVRQRGLCYQWAEDLLAKLRTLDLKTLELHWGIARGGTYREHNCLVITARQQPFKDGLVLDAWRHSGRLYWARVLADHYPWEEGVLDPLPSPRATASVSFLRPTSRASWTLLR